MAKAKHVYLSGKGQWFHRLFEPDDYLGVRKWKFDFIPDPKSLEVFKALKTKKRGKDVEGSLAFTIDRPVMKPWTPKEGENPEFDPPRITDSEGNLWEEGKVIGNGSAVTIKVEVYDYKFKGTPGTAVRLEALRVDDWVEYVAPEENPVAPTTGPGTTKVAETKTRVHQPNDAIPF